MSWDVLLVRLRKPVASVADRKNDEFAQQIGGPRVARQLQLHTGDLIVDNFAGGGGASLGIEWPSDGRPTSRSTTTPRRSSIGIANPDIATRVRGLHVDARNAGHVDFDSVAGVAVAARTRSAHAARLAGLRRHPGGASRAAAPARHFVGGTRSKLVRAGRSTSRSGCLRRHACAETNEPPQYSVFSGHGFVQ